MAVVVTTMARVRNWRALRKLHDELLLERAREVGARYRLYRNLYDASLVLIVAELPDREAARDIRESLGEHLDLVLAGEPADERLWEPTGWEQGRADGSGQPGRKEVV